MNKNFHKKEEKVVVSHGKMHAMQLGGRCTCDLPLRIQDPAQNSANESGLEFALLQR